MQVLTNEPPVNNSIPPCKGYKSYPELLQAAKNDLVSALECLGRVCLKLVIPFLKRHKISGSEAEDIGIIALSVFIQKLKESTSETKIGLLWTIAIRRVIDSTRKAGGNVQELGSLIEAVPDTDTSIGFDEDGINQYLELFKKHYLDKKEKEVFVLYYEENLTMAEIVKETGHSQAEAYRIKASIDNVKRKKFEEDLRVGNI